VSCASQGLFRLARTSPPLGIVFLQITRIDQDALCFVLDRWT
jgi:hypothetical protein